MNLAVFQLDFQLNIDFPTLYTICQRIYTTHLENHVRLTTTVTAYL